MECEYEEIEVLKDYQKQDIFFHCKKAEAEFLFSRKEFKISYPKLYEMYQNPKFREWIKNLEFECEGGLIAGGKFVHNYMNMAGNEFIKREFNQIQSL